MRRGERGFGERRTISTGAETRKTAVVWLGDYADVVSGLTLMLG